MHCRVAEYLINVVVPIPMDETGVGYLATRLPPQVIAPGFKPEFTAVPSDAAVGDSYQDMLLMDWTVFQADIDVGVEGYSAVVIDTDSDPSQRTLRSRLNIPVINPGLIACKQAELLVQLGLTQSKKSFSCAGGGK